MQGARAKSACNSVGSVQSRSSDLEELYVKDAKIRTFRVARSAHSYFFLEISYTYVYSSDQNEIMSVAKHKDNHSVKIYD